MSTVLVVPDAPGAAGHAVLFVTPREQHLLRSIERTTGQRISRIALPSPEDITNQRIQRFKQKLTRPFLIPQTILTRSLSTCAMKWVKHQSR